MGNIQHPNAKTTPAIRKEIQDSKESVAKLAARLSLNEKTILKWRHAGRVVDNYSGPTKPKSSLSTTEQSVVCEFRRVTQLPLDDVYVAMKPQIPALTRSNLHRLLVRNGLNIRPKEAISPKSKKKFKDYEPGFLHIDITEIAIETGKLYLFVSIDRATKYVYVEIHPRMTGDIACEFLKNVIADCPFKITKILTDNGAQFTHRLLLEHLRPKTMHKFDVLCAEHGIEHRLTKFRYPWTNGQVEVTNRVLKSYTTKEYHYETQEEIKKHMMAFLLVYNFKRPLRALKFQTPYATIIKWFEQKPQIFKQNPHHKIMGLNNM
jgi:transposase InsO family protein